MRAGIHPAAAVGDPATAAVRRFREKAGFPPDGTTNIRAGLGDAGELSCARDL